MAGFLDSITNIFTGKPGIEAAQQQRQYLAQQQQEQAARFAQTQQQGIGALQAGQSGGLGALQNAYGTATGDILGGTYPALNTLFGYGQLGAGALTDAQQQAIQALQGGVGSAVGAYSPLLQAAQGYGGNAASAASAQADAMGLNGPEGVQRALSAFQTSPGYQFQLGQGLDALTRAANVTGSAAGGNTLQAAQQYGQGLANQEWNNYLTGLQGRQQLYAPLEAQGLAQYGAGTASPYLTGGTGTANIYTGTGGQLSNLYSGLGSQGAGIYTGTGGNLANLASNLLGTAPAGIYTGTGGNIANLLQGISGQQTNYNQGVLGPYSGTYTTEANAALGGSKNLWNAILGGAQLAASGGLSGLPGISNLGTAFSGTPSLPFFLNKG